MLKIEKIKLHPIKYFLQPYQQLNYQHGGIGYTDIEKILTSEGYQPIYLPEAGTLSTTVRRWITMFKWLKKIPAGSEVVCQFPVYARAYQMLVRKLLDKKIRLIMLILDIDGLKDGNTSLLQKEIRHFKKCRNFIVHSPNMESWIKQYIPDAIISKLGPFDFLTYPSFRQRNPSPELAFAGNLEKSKFLNQLHKIPEITFHVYGNGGSESMKNQDNVTWHGVFDAYQLPGMLAGSFGLVWDGNSINGAGGHLGEYMQYVFHHKLSLYILAGMPVIVPAFAGSASYVLEKGIGWVVNDMNEIPALIKRLDNHSYQLAVNNLRPIAESISKGSHLRNALREVGGV